MRPNVPTARDFMTRSLVTLRPEMRVLEAAGILLKHKISGAPVVDGDGNFLGLLSEYDCLRAVSSAEYDLDNHDAVVNVADLMTREVHSIAPELDLFGIAHEFVTLRVRRLPVVEDGRLIGQVSRRDALRAAVDLRQKILSQKHYPDYPKGREPIRSYPKRR
jgi:CBS domain-containing protein